MCEAPICRCHLAPEPKKLVLEVGKTYDLSDGRRVLIKTISHYISALNKLMVAGQYLDRDLSPIPYSWDIFHPDGYLYSSMSASSKVSGRIVREYKLPVVHKRDLVWYRYADKLHCAIVGVGEQLPRVSLKTIVHRETVTFTEA